MNRHRALFAIAATALLLTAALPAPARAQGDTPDPILTEARRLFEALDYERAVVALDRAVSLLEARTPRDDATRLQLADAYELRARARFGLNDRDGARADFNMLVKLDPGHTFTGRVSPNIVAMFEDVKKPLVGFVNFAIAPADAEVQVDGVAMAKASGRTPVIVGTHAVSIARPSYRTVTQNITVTAGGTADLAVTLERVSALVSVATAPPEVEVVLDGASRGVTANGPAPPDYPTGGIPPNELSKPLFLSDVAPGQHVIEFRRPCYVTSQQRLDVQRPADYRIEPVKLARATGRIAIEAGAGASVFLDGQPRGAAPVTLDDVCEGRHIVDVRSPSGRHVSRLEVHTGDSLSVNVVLKPAVAILSVLGLPEGLRGGDIRQSLEKALLPTRTLALIALPQEDVTAALAREKLSPGWLSFDAGRHPIGEAAAIVTAAARQDLSARLARALDVQGVAAMTIASKQDQSRILLTILAAGSGEPDTIEMNLDDPESIGRAIARLEATATMFRLTTGVQVIDVLDVTGPVVAAVNPASGTAASVAVGDVITAANGQPVPDVAKFNQTVGAAKAGQHLLLELRDRAGATKKADVIVGRVPDAITMVDQTVLFNPLLLDLRRRLMTGDPADESITRLNLAIALMGVGNWTDARAELEKLRLPDGPGVSGGTVQYLIGLCREGTGDFAEAAAAWKQAATSTEATLTTDGPLVRELAERKLAELARRRKSS